MLVLKEHRHQRKITQDCETGQVGGCQAVTETLGHGSMLAWIDCRCAEKTCLVGWGGCVFCPEITSLQNPTVEKLLFCVKLAFASNGTWSCG